MTDTKRSLYEIEVALAKSDMFNYVRNIVVFNVIGTSSILPIGHECDMLVLTKAGYLHEIEIKRSWSDFRADFSKGHHHEGNRLVKYFCYCVPSSIKDKVFDYLCENKVHCSSLLYYDEDLKIGSLPLPHFPDDEKWWKAHIARANVNKLFIEQRLELARYGAMRVIGLKEKLIKKK